MAKRFRKRYRVVRIGDDGKVDDALVLRVRKDPAAWLAAWDYADLTDNIELGQRLRAWLRKNRPTEETLGSEGRTNREWLGGIAKVLNTSNQ